MIHAGVRWGILGTASIATRKVIPGLRASARGAVVAVASRDRSRAIEYARANEIGAAFGSYQELLDCDAVDAVYIPLPNHLHVEWSLCALEAGKHVLCEKPIGMNAGEARALLAGAARHPSLKVAEAFMYRCHPRWEAARKLVEDGAVGTLRTVHTFFSYDNRDPANIRNIAETGGGAWLDIGCYGVSVARWLFAAEPASVQATVDRDPVFGTDRLTSAVLRVGGGTATVTCATQMTPHQSVSILGTNGRIELDMPFNPPSDVPTAIRLHRAGLCEDFAYAPCDQFTIQADRFNAAVLDGGDVVVGIDDAVANMRVLDRLTGAAG
jgi:predicted dehydrogenase